VSEQPEARRRQKPLARWQWRLFQLGIFLIFISATGRVAFEYLSSHQHSRPTNLSLYLREKLLSLNLVEPIEYRRHFGGVSLSRLLDRLASIESPREAAVDALTRILEENDLKDNERLVQIDDKTRLILPRITYTNDSGVVSLVLGPSPESDYSSSNTQVRITGSGLAFDPSDWQNITVQGEFGLAYWTFRPSTVGNFLVVITSKAVDPKLPSVPMEMPLVERKMSAVSADQKSSSPLPLLKPPFARLVYPFDLDIQRKWWSYFTDNWATILQFLGTFATVPGILAFFSQQKKEKAEIASKEAKEAKRHGYAGEINWKELASQKKSR